MTTQQFNIGNGSLWLGDCLELMRHVPDASVDMILCDLPYGTTACAWDTIIPFDVLWSHYWRIAKPNAAVVLTASQPFTSALVMSDASHFKYEWIWNKQIPSGMLNAKHQPMRQHESVLVFAKSKITYNPEMKLRDVPIVSGGMTKGSVNNHHTIERMEVKTYTHKYPISILDFDKVRGNMKGGRINVIHPTQKPVALFEYFIKTYTNPGDLVLDNCSGSGTTAVAAQASGRRWLCIEKEPSYYYASCGRVHAAVTP